MVAAQRTHLRPFGEIVAWVYPNRLRYLGIGRIRPGVLRGGDMYQVLFGSALLISFLGGVVALLAPCCVSVMLPAFFATGFSRRTGIAAATGAFAAGVVAPLAVIALVWEGRDWGSSRLLHGRRVRLGFGRLAREMPLGSAASGLVLVAMGVLTLITAVTGPSLSSSGWRETMTAFLQHANSVTARALSWLPGWAVLLVLAALAAALATLAVRARRRTADTDTGPGGGRAAGPPSPHAVIAEITENTTASIPAGGPREGSQP